jgi:hypothetical protein
MCAAHQQTLDLLRGEKYRKPFTAKELGKAIGGWEIVQYDVVGCRYVSTNLAVIFSLHM